MRAALRRQNGTTPVKLPIVIHGERSELAERFSDHCLSAKLAYDLNAILPGVSATMALPFMKAVFTDCLRGPVMQIL
jgi:hypothetical protein